ncbi:MAG: thiamine pyrophosphate-binding protein [Rhodospirillaceae bacterium]|nr:thiamine pyrophosphate-binding protein [Rhodospirillaceae bacterium]MCY4239857.1 thiamine pyrophosphate-binding protein [Rhodospirillaceae bacterium]
MPDSTALMSDWSADVLIALKDLDIRQIAYVPDAGLANILQLAGENTDIAMISVASEEDAVALSGGAWLGGQRTLVAMQSSGVGNILNMLTLPCVCEMPLLMLVTMRGEPGEANPWQYSTGMAVSAMLSTVGVEVRRVETAGEVGTVVRKAGEDAFLNDRQICVQIAQSIVGFKGFCDQGKHDAAN